MVAILVIGYLLIFSEDTNINKELEIEAEKLQRTRDSLDRVILLDRKYIETLEKKDREWERLDSLKNIVLMKIREEVYIIKSKLKDATTERERAEKDLSDFKKSKPKIKDPFDLINDTKKRINND